MNKDKISRQIKSKALELGFLSVGISKVEFLEQEAKHLENWLSNNYNRKMAYMANHFDKRLDPSKLLMTLKVSFPSSSTTILKKIFLKGRNLRFPNTPTAKIIIR